MDERHRAERDFLKENARIAREIGLGMFEHLDHPAGQWTYIEIADDIAGQLPSGRILDWGCLFGQMTYLLRRRGFEVVPFDLGDPDRPPPLAPIPLSDGLAVVRTLHPTELPFPDASFDAVLSCGTLEHVDEMSEPGNEAVVLREIARVVRPGGSLFVYQLPQRLGWQEAVLRRLERGYTHPRRYTVREITGELGEAGLRVTRVRRSHLLPRNLTGVPGRLRGWYGRLGRALVRADLAASAVPLVNRLAGTLDVTARREGG